MDLIAHRGFRVGLPENSLPAFRRAHQLGVTAIELDVHRSRDGRVVVMHDARLNRTTTGRGKIRRRKWRAIARLALEDEPGRPHPDVHPPCLEQVLAEIPRPTRLMIELKGKGVVEAVVRLVRDHAAADRVTFSGRRLAVLRQAQELLPACPTCLNITHCRAFPLDAFLETRAPNALPLRLDMVSLRATRVTRRFVAACRRTGVKPLAWDFLRRDDPVAFCQSLARVGVQGVLLDDPATLLAVRALETENASQPPPRSPSE